VERYLATIAKIGAKLECDSNGFLKGIAAGIGALTGFVGKVKSAVSNVPFMGAALSALTAGAIAAYLVHVATATIQTTRFAESVDSSTESIVLLHEATVGLSTSTADVDAGLQSLGGFLGRLQTGSYQSADAVERLGLGFSNLASMTTDQAFFRIADRLSRIPDVTERAALAYSVFGQAANRLLPLLSVSAAEFDHVRTRIDATGQAFSGSQGQQLVAAAASLERAKNALEGIARQIVIGLTPYVEAFGNALTSAGNSGRQFASELIDAFEGIAKAIARLKADWEDVAGIVRGLSRLNGPAQAVRAYRSFSAVPTGEDSVSAFFRQLRERATQAGAAANRLNREIGGVNTRLAEMFQRAGNVIQQSRTPLQTLREEVLNLNAMVDAGAISWETFAHAATAAALALERAHHINDLRLPGAAEYNTQAAQSMIARSSVQERLSRERPEDRVARILEQSRDIEQNQLAIQRAVAAELRRLVQNVQGGLVE